MSRKSIKLAVFISVVATTQILVAQNNQQFPLLPPQNLSQQQILELKTMLTNQQETVETRIQLQNQDHQNFTPPAPVWNWHFNNLFGFSNGQFHGFADQNHGLSNLPVFPALRPETLPTQQQPAELAQEFRARMLGAASNNSQQQNLDSGVFYPTQQRQGLIEKTLQSNTIETVQHPNTIITDRLQYSAGESLQAAVDPIEMPQVIDQQEIVGQHQIGGEILEQTLNRTQRFELAQPAEFDQGIQSAPVVQQPRQGLVAPQAEIQSAQQNWTQTLPNQNLQLPNQTVTTQPANAPESQTSQIETQGIQPAPITPSSRTQTKSLAIQGSSTSKLQLTEPNIQTRPQTQIETEFENCFPQEQSGAWSEYAVDQNEDQDAVELELDFESSTAPSSLAPTTAGTATSIAGSENQPSIQRGSSTIASQVRSIETRTNISGKTATGQSGLEQTAAGKGSAGKLHRGKAVVHKTAASKRNRKAAAGWWWLPLMLIPLIGWFAWRFFGAKKTRAGERNTAARPAAKARPEADRSFVSFNKAKANSNQLYQVGSKKRDSASRKTTEVRSLANSETNSKQSATKETIHQSTDSEFVLAERVNSNSAKATAKFASGETHDVATCNCKDCRHERSESKSESTRIRMSTNIENSEFENVEYKAQFDETEEQPAQIDSLEKGTDVQPRGNKSSDILESNVSGSKIQKIDSSKPELRIVSHDSVDAETAAIEGLISDDAHRIAGANTDRDRTSCIESSVESKLETKLESNDQHRSVQERSVSNSRHQQRAKSASNRSDQQVQAELRTEMASSTADTELVQIDGLSQKQIQCLNAAGICSLTQFKELKPKKLQQMFAKSGLPELKLNQAQKWLKKAKLASSQTEAKSNQNLEQKPDSEETNLEEFNRTSNMNFAHNEAVSTSNKFAQTAGDHTSGTTDDLTKIHGIGPATAKLLYENGITRFSELASARSSWLQKLLEKAGPKFRLIDSSTWNHQAAFAAKGNWDGLGQWFNSKKSELNLSVSSNTDAAIETELSDGIDVGDDLTAINGIGPATANLLRKNGITRFDQLDSIDGSWLEGLFDKSGIQFATVNWKTWGKQAGFAIKGNWSGLRDWCLANNPSVEPVNCKSSQTIQVKGAAKPKTKTSSKISRSAEPIQTERAANSWELSNAQPDNLTAIHGIGPATAKILKSNGITRFEQIAAMSGSQLENIFASSGARFQLVDPTSWPEQAIGLLNEHGRCQVETSLLSDIAEIQSLKIENPPAIVEQH